jgi:hypothetical protein
VAGVANAAIATAAAAMPAFFEMFMCCTFVEQARIGDLQPQFAGALMRANR